MTCTLLDLLRSTVERAGSDLHLTAGAPPLVRERGELRRLGDHSPLTPDATRELVYSRLSAAQQERHERGEEVDLSFGVAGLARFRCNAFRQRGAVAAVYRLVPEQIPSFDELGLPPVVRTLAGVASGLVLVTGPTGSGKSTTLAALVDTINVQRREHILTIEDPIEFVHAHKQSIVNQREVHADCASFSSALRAALREDPDVVLIGEMRDRETMEVALRIAETGHLTLATLHTGSAVQTINRVVDMFPAGQHQQVRSQLAAVLEGLVCQTLVPAADGAGRVAAVEVMVATPAIRNLIREGKSQQVYSVLQTSQDSLGMQTMNQSLAALVGQGRIRLADALARSSNRDELQAAVRRSPAAAGGPRWPAASGSGRAG